MRGVCMCSGLLWGFRNTREIRYFFGPLFAFWKIACLNEMFVCGL